MATEAGDGSQNPEGARVKAFRIWTRLDVEQVRKQMLLTEDLYGTCGNCKQLGLNFTKDRKCPSCGAEFRYLAARVRDAGESVKLMKRIEQDALNLTLIDRDDFERAAARDALHNLFDG